MGGDGRTPPDVATQLRRAFAAAPWPTGLPPLPAPLRLAVGLTDGQGFVVELGPSWTIAVGALVPGEVHDGALVAPVALVAGVVAGECDLGVVAEQGLVSGTLASQSALAFLVEWVAEHPTARSGSAQGVGG